MSLFEEIMGMMRQPQGQAPQQQTPQVQVQPAPQQPQPNSLSQYAESPFQQLIGMFQKPEQPQMAPLPDGSQNLQQPQKQGGLFSSLLKLFAGGA